KPLPPPAATQLRPIVLQKQNSAVPVVFGAVFGVLGTMVALRGRRKK
ncbi:membrane protein, partial [Amycolatopsis sulphurea]